jgi:Tfp pilus assembly protein PilF
MTKAIRAIAALAAIVLIGCSTHLQAKRNQSEALRNVARQYFNQGDYTAALRNLLEAEQLYDKDPELHNDLGLTYMAKNELEPALTHFKQALALKPDFAYARNNMGIAYLQGRRWDDAIACFNPLLKDLLYDTPHIVRANLGFAHFSKKNYAIAEQYYQQALELAPTYVNALHGLGCLYIETNQPASATKTLEKAVKFAPRIAAVHFDLARAWELAGNKPQARSAYQKAMELENREGPFSTKAAEALDRLK